MDMYNSVEVVVRSGCWDSSGSVAHLTDRGVSEWMELRGGSRSRDGGVWGSAREVFSSPGEAARPARARQMREALSIKQGQGCDGESDLTTSSFCRRML